MSIAQAETLKRELTDKYVVVKKGVAELRRFDGLTGQVKTVNMNGQVLVQFDGPVDISWYDIHPSYLQVVDAPLPKAKPEAKGHAEKGDGGEKAAAKPKPAAGKSPLEMARAQGAGGAAPPAKPAAPAGEKKLSPLEMARAQGAGGAAKPAAPVAEKKASPLEQARQQGAPKAEAPAPAAAPAKPVPAPAAAKPALEKPGSTAEIIELARQQGAVKS